MEIFLSCLLSMAIIFQRVADAEADTSWTDAHATFYGGADASGTMGM